jgi:hypothetical protein
MFGRFPILDAQMTSYALSLVHFFGWLRISYDLLVDKSGAQVHMVLVYVCCWWISLCYDPLNVTGGMVFKHRFGLIRICLSFSSRILVQLMVGRP